MTTINNRPVASVKRPAVKVTAASADLAVAPEKAIKATGPAKTGGKVVGGAVGAVGGFGLGAVGALGLGLAKWGMRSAPGWFAPVAWAGIGLTTVLGAFGGAKLLGGLGEKIENWIKK